MLPLWRARRSCTMSAKLGQEVAPRLGKRASTEKAPLVPKEGDVQGFACTTIIYLIAAAVSTQEATKLAAQYFLKDTFLLGPTGIAYYLSFSSVGWIIKPVWGFVSDSLPILGQRRRPYLVLMAGLGALCFLGYGVVQTVPQFLCLLIATNCCLAFLSVIAQALLVQRSKEEKLEVASFNFTSYFGVIAVCGAALTFSVGLFLDKAPPRQALMLFAGLLVSLLMPVPFMEETSGAGVLSPVEQCKTVLQLFKRREVWGVTLYMLVFCAMPGPSSAMFFFNVNVLGFSATFLATISVVSAGAQVLGLVFYHRCLTGVPFRLLFAAATLLCAVISATPLIQVWRLNRRWGIDDHVFALVDTFIIDLIGEILWIPVLVLCSRLCPPSAQGTTYAIFLSIHNLGGWMAGMLSSATIWMLGITRDDLSNLQWLIAICCLANLVPLCFLPLVPNLDPEAMRDSENPVGDGAGRTA